jgi:TPP-dependent pyruvate/acetoin dehydrogenase alpha subunit
MATKLREPSEVTLASGHSNPLISHQKLRQLYSTMLQCRLLDERARILEKRSGAENDPYSSAGLEATAVGAAIDLRPADTIAAPHRDLIVNYVKGLPLTSMFGRLHGRSMRSEIGCASPDESKHAQLNIVPAAANVPAQLEVCIRVAFANQRKKNGSVVMAFFGEGALPLKDWNDALRFAGQRSLPVIFVRQSHPLGGPGSTNFESGSDDIRAEAVDYGFPAITVDGNDAVAVYRVAQEAIERARAGGRPTLIEAQISPGYRSSLGHRPQYGAEAEIDQMESNDPIAFMERYLRGKGLFSQQWKKEIMAAFQQELDAADSDSCGQALDFLQTHAPTLS